jgi:tRNA threonylcarbamoyladenosine biosynthesis protein TsaE
MIEEIYIEINSLTELSFVAKKIIVFADTHTIWLLEGEMGAGKTTLSKALCKEFGVIDTVSSPTFSIVNQYLTQKDETIYHFDFYRLKNEKEALAIGIEEYFDSGNICLLEWASNIKNLLPERHLVIEISKDKNQQNEKRIFRIYQKKQES